MKLFKKLCLVFFSFTLAISCGLAIKGLIPQKQVNATDSAYKYRYISDLSVDSSVNLWNNTYALNAPISPVETINNSILLKRGTGLVNESFNKAVVFNRGDATKEGGLVFNISGLNATRFTATIGINQTTTNIDNPNAGIAKFKVYADNKQIYDSGIAYYRNGQYGNLDVAIPSGTTLLKLFAYDDPSQQDIVCEHAVFANPRLYGTNLVGGIEGSSLDLSEMPYEYKEAIGWYDNIAINEAYPVDGKSVALSLKTSNGNVTYDKGICIQANDDNTGASPAKVSWNIEGINAYRFTATIGLNQRSGLADNQGSVKFQVRFRIRAGADEIRYESKTFYRTTEAEKIDVLVPADATHIVLAVLNAGDGFDFDNGTFAEPKLYCDSVCLSSMSASSTSMGYGDLLYNDTMSGKATLYNLITEGGTTHSRHTYFHTNLFTHATSHVDFSIKNMHVTRFACYVGITSTKTGSDGIIFDVHADGNYVGSVTTAQYQQMAKLDVNIPAGAQTITLSALSAVGDNNSDHGIWCAPTFFGNNVNGVKDISLTAENDSLAVGETTEFKTYSCTFDGKVEKLTNFTITSDNPSVVSVSGHKVTANAVGSAKITVNTTIYGITYTTYTNVVVGASNSNTNAQLNLASPDGKTKIIITLNNGWIDYSATKGGNLFVEKSRMGVQTSYGDMWNGFTFKNISTIRTIDETYDAYSGKFAQNHNYCKEQDITFTHSSGATLKVIARAYNDGVAFRYVVTGNNGQSFTMINENTSICIPFFSTTWSSPMPENGSPSGKQYTHEQPVTECMVSSFSGKKVVPYMYKTPDDVYCLVTESDLDGSYWGSVLISEFTKILRLTRSAQQTNDLAISSGTLTMPWRAFIAGSLEEVIKSTMVEDLAPPAKTDPSGANWEWVDAGVTSWSWMDGVNQFWGNGGDSLNGQQVNMKPINGMDKTITWNYNNVVLDWQGNPEAIKMYIDLAADMGWEYFILDMGWQPRQSVASAKDGNGLIDGEPVGNWQVFDDWFDGVFDWMTTKTQYHKGGATGYTGTKIVDYAESKGVKLITWIHTGHIDTEKRMNKVFGMLKDIGIKGIKVDFFDSENQWTMDLYQKLYEKTAEYQLLGIFHGSNKPSGERRTWPHVINREAIPGEELNNTKVSQQSIYAYLRGTVGPTDLTPYIYTIGTGDTNMASQMAFSIIYESGMTCFASTAAEYNGLNSNVKYYYKNFPDRWQDIKLISGEVGKKMSVARKALNNKWYVGCISTEATTDTFKLDFLDSGKNYIAHIYTDKTDRRAVDYKTQTVTNQTSLTLTTQANGGYVVLLEEAHVCSPASTKYYSNTTQHWQLCSCGAKLNVVSHTYNQKTQTNIASQATCTSPAKYYYTCTCGAVGTTTYNYGSALGHTFTKQDTASKYLKSEATCTTKAVYYKCCEACGLSSKGQTGEATFTSGNTLAHTFTKQDTADKYLKSSATCTTKAVYYKCCSSCGLSSKGQTGEATFTSGNMLAHTFTKQDTNSKYLKSEATCMAKAVYYKCCEACGLSSKGQTGEATFTSGNYADHSFGTWVEEIPAKEGIAGTKGHYYCAICDKYFDIDKNEITDLTIPALPITSSSSSSSVNTQASNTSVSTQAPSTQAPSTSATSQTTSTQTPSVSQEKTSESTAISSSNKVSSVENSSSKNKSSSSSKPITSEAPSRTPSRGGCSGNISTVFALPFVVLALFAIIKLSKKKEN